MNREEKLEVFKKAVQFGLWQAQGLETNSVPSSEIWT
jgi:hypothetical protein